MVMTAHEAVKASFQDPTRWRQTLDNFGQEALRLILDDQHFAEEMQAAAGTSFRDTKVGEGIMLLFSALKLPEVFFLNGNSEERQVGPRLSHWDSHRQSLSIKRVQELMIGLPLVEQLRQLRPHTLETYPMVGYQAQLFTAAAEVIVWPEGTAKLAAALIKYEGAVGDDEDFQVVVDAWAEFIDSVLPPYENRSAA